MKRMALALGLFILIGSGALSAQRPGVATDADHINPILPGQTVPDVTFKTLEGTDFKLLEEVAKKPMLLIFYRGGW